MSAEKEELVAGKNEATGNDDDKKTDEEKKTTDSDQSSTDFLSALIQKSLQLKENQPEKLLDDLTIDGVAKYISEGKCKNIITMAGAGISTSAGIPDFRSPGTGLYDNLEKYNLPNPQAVFDISYFEQNPEPFFTLARELMPGEYKPTPCHYFLRMLYDRGLLLRHYTQNIDSLEVTAGLDPEKVVEAHGTFRTSHCRKCQKLYAQEWMKAKILAGGVPSCDEDECGGVVKPDIVFFGEKLPGRFLSCLMQDFTKCDLLIILGTSLVVEPFASLTKRVTDTTPRLYINLEKSGLGNSDPVVALIFGPGFKFDDDDNYRDVYWQGTCDDGSYALADLLGWGDELRTLVKEEHKKLDEKVAENIQMKPEEKPKTTENTDVKTEVKDTPEKKSSAL